ncbi:hypothetical protein OPT61_g8826 [Boeremia exigua]|uniref:Uncharacterized protein n=1 Tax=Boeremia exigua TaxID=749465 RepID=A0ACC2HWQ6_9PLEO|nr:hypothetical protein OPT61_g8826 [Boeremia exigua]
MVRVIPPLLLTISWTGYSGQNNKRTGPPSNSSVPWESTSVFGESGEASDRTPAPFEPVRPDHMYTSSAGAHRINNQATVPATNGFSLPPLPSIFEASTSATTARVWPDAETNIPRNIPKKRKGDLLNRDTLDLRQQPHSNGDSLFENLLEHYEQEVTDIIKQSWERIQRVATLYHGLQQELQIDLYSHVSQEGENFEHLGGDLEPAITGMQKMFGLKRYDYLYEYVEIPQDQSEHLLTRTITPTGQTVPIQGDVNPQPRTQYPIMPPSTIESSNHISSVIVAKMDEVHKLVDKVDKTHKGFDRSINRLILDSVMCQKASKEKDNELAQMKERIAVLSLKVEALNPRLAEESTSTVDNASSDNEADHRATSSSHLSGNTSQSQMSHSQAGSASENGAAFLETQDDNLYTPYRSPSRGIYDEL